MTLNALYLLYFYIDKILYWHCFRKTANRPGKRRSGSLPLIKKGQHLRLPNAVQTVDFNPIILATQWCSTSLRQQPKPFLLDKIDYSKKKWVRQEFIKKILYIFILFGSYTLAKIKHNDLHRPASERIADSDRECVPERRIPCRDQIGYIQIHSEDMRSKTDRGK